MKNTKGHIYDIDQEIRELKDNDKFNQIEVFNSELCFCDLYLLQSKCNLLKIYKCTIICNKELEISSNIIITNTKFKGIINKIKLICNNDSEFTITNCNLNDKEITFCQKNY